MTRALRGSLAAVLLVAGVVGIVLFLTGQSLDRAEKMISIVGVVVSVALSAAGLVLAWWARRDAAPPAAQARRTGDATARGAGSRAVSGVSADGSAPNSVDRTGRAEASDGGSAVTGIDKPSGS